MAESGSVRPPIDIVVAMAANRVIGADNRLLWHLKTDLQRFRALTMGKPLIMGRKTFQSIGRPLPGRHTIVITRDPSFQAEGVQQAASVAEALAMAERTAREVGASGIMVGGGGEIYAHMLPLADRLFVTSVRVSPAGDTHFPPIDPTDWSEVARVEHAAGPTDEWPFAFIDYERRRARG